MKKVIALCAAFLTLASFSAKAQLAVNAGAMIATDKIQTVSGTLYGPYVGATYAIPLGAEDVVIAPGAQVSFLFGEDGRKELGLTIPVNFGYKYELSSGTELWSYVDLSAFMALIGKTNAVNNLYQDGSNLKRFNLLIGFTEALQLSDNFAISAAFHYGLLNMAKNGWDYKRNVIVQLGIVYNF